MSKKDNGTKIDIGIVSIRYWLILEQTSTVFLNRIFLCVCEFDAAARRAVPVAALKSCHQSADPLTCERGRPLQAAVFVMLIHLAFRDTVSFVRWLSALHCRVLLPWDDLAKSVCRSVPIMFPVAN